jgi:hypothetical protein
VAAGAESVEAALAEMIQQNLRHDAPSGVAGAEKQHVELSIGFHGGDLILPT